LDTVDKFTVSITLYMSFQAKSSIAKRTQKVERLRQPLAATNEFCESETAAFQ
jgi:hypothetical protein